MELWSSKGVPIEKTEDFVVKFMRKSTTFDRMQAALKSLAKPICPMSKGLLKSVLGQVEQQPLMKGVFSKAELDKLDKNASAPNLPALNLSQAAAVKQVLQTPLSLIQGPPGTGKTVTSATIVYHMVHAKGPGPEMGQILVCAPSNVAVDQLAGKIAQTGVKVVRVCAWSREAEVSSVQPITLHHMMASVADDSPLLRKFPWAAEFLELRRKKASGGKFSRKEDKKLNLRLDALGTLLLKVADVI